MLVSPLSCVHAHHCCRCEVCSLVLGLSARVLRVKRTSHLPPVIGTFCPLSRLMVGCLSHIFESARFSYMCLRSLRHRGGVGGAKQVLVFSQMTRMLDILQDYCGLRGYGSSRLDGSMGLAVREEEVSYTFSSPQQLPPLVLPAACALSLSLAVCVPY